MISQINITVNAAKPKFPLSPMVAFNGSPSSVRISGVPCSIGNWSINSVRVLVSYPNNFTVEKTAVKVDNFWIATIDGSQVNGVIKNGFQVVADGVDENNLPVNGYVLGVGDVVVLPRDKGIEKLVDRYAVRYLNQPPVNPSIGDMLNLNGQFKVWDGSKWVSISGEDVVVYDSQITLQANGVEFGSFTVNASEAKAIDIPVPSKVSELNNDIGYITASQVPPVPSKVSELDNDAGYITMSAIPAIPSKTSDLDNDSGFITASAIPSNISSFNNDVGYLSAVTWNDVSGKPNIPSNTSDLVNDSGFITASAIPSNVSAFNNDVGYLTASSSAFIAKRDKTDLVYKVGFDKNNLDMVVKFVVEYVDGNNQNVTATLDKYDEFTQTWTGENTNWKVYTYLVGMGSELYFALDDGTGGQDAKPAPSQGAEDTSWNFIYNSNPATWTLVMTQNIALQQDFKNLRNMKDISYPASVDSTGMYTIQKFNVNGTEVAHFTASGSTSTWDTNDPVVNQYEISTTDGTNFTMLSNGIQIGTFTMTNLKNGVVDVTYDGNTYTVGAVFKQTTFALKDYVDSQIGSINTALDNINGEVI